MGAAHAIPAAIACCLLGACASAPRPAPADHPANRVISQLHDAASQADGDRYFSLFADDAIFLGTDPEERWTLAQFRNYAEPHFSRGEGWTYHETWRHTTIAADGRTAWFDEELANDSYGRCRGSGVLIRTPAGWRIAQYNLTIPIPNDLARDTAQRIRDHAGDGSTN